MKKLPTRNELMSPTIEVIKELGGSEIQMRYTKKL